MAPSPPLPEFDHGYSEACRRSAIRAWAFAGISSPPSILRLLRGLLDAQADGQRLLAAAVPRAARRRGTERVEPDGDAHMGIGGTNPVRRIEGDPAEARHMSFRPGVAGVEHAHAVAPDKVSADVARRNADGARARNEDMSVVLADPALARKGFSRRRRGICAMVIVGH